MKQRLYNVLESSDSTQQVDLIGQQVLPVLQYGQHRLHQPEANANHQLIFDQRDWLIQLISSLHQRFVFLAKIMTL